MPRASADTVSWGDENRCAGVQNSGMEAPEGARAEQLPQSLVTMVTGTRWQALWVSIKGSSGMAAVMNSLGNRKRAREN